MSNKKLIIFIFISILLSGFIVLLKNNGQEVDFSLLCYGIIMVYSCFFAITLVYFSIKDFKYIVLKNYKVHRFYKVPKVVLRLFQVITLALYLFFVVLCVICKDLSWSLQFGPELSLLYFFVFPSCFQCFYCNENTFNLVYLDKEIEYKNILNYNIKKFNNNVSILEIITENKNYKINASKQMVEAFLIVYQKNNGPKVY